MITVTIAATSLGDVSVVDKPPTASRNRHYAGNRAPLVNGPLVKLPVGAIRPKGWLRKQLELQAAGFHGYLWELSPFVKREGNAWLSPKGEGHSPWEELPYWLKGFGDCGYVLGDQRVIAEAKRWIEGVIASQRDDGWFGPRANLTRLGGKPDLWPNMAMLNCLQSYHELTGDARIIALMQRYFRWQLALKEEDFLLPDWQKRRAGDNLLSVLWLYNRTGEKWLLELAEKIHRRTDPWMDRLVNLHNVDVSQGFREPGAYYLLTGKPEHLAAAYRNHFQVRERFGQVPGGMFGGDENCRDGFGDPRQAIETCGMVEQMLSDELLLAATGDLAWADHCEDVAFNSLPAALTADMKALRYLTSPNLVLSNKASKAPGLQNGGNMLEMNPHSHRCCQHNFGHGWPYFAEHLWMATPDDGLAAVLYSASEVTAKVGDGTQVTIKQDTHYPFDGEIALSLSIAAPAKFPLYLRVPSWCNGARLTINGEAISAAARPASLMRVERAWSNGDRVALNLPMSINLRTWEKNQRSVSVDRGPLIYALRIGEKLVRSGGTDRWPAWEIHPTTAWNYGLVFDRDDPAAVFKTLQRPWPKSDMPWTLQDSPIELHALGRKIPQWKSDYLGLVGLLQASPAHSDEPTEEIVLVPMGAARLRIASFPVIGPGPGAHTWVVPPDALPLKVSASHCNAGDTVRAVADKLVPKSSRDQSIPRFTWWDHKGTSEWIEMELDEPREVSQAQVYWFDDEPSGGCRTPKSWRLLYRSGGKWHPVEAAAAFSVDKDKFNAVSFQAVKTDALRIEADLRPGFSAGILEWRVP